MTTSDDDKKRKNKKRSLFAESEELEKKLVAARAKADFDRQNALTTETARDVAAMLLVKALNEEFEKTDRLQGGSFIHGSMERLHSGMWKGALKK